MKKTLLLFLLLIAIILQGKGNFADANSPTSINMDFNEERLIIEDLFTQRALLWNTIYNDSSSTEGFRQQLHLIEEDPLLSYDINAFDEMKDSPTDLDKVLGFSIIHIEDLAYGRSNIYANIKAVWKMQGHDSYYFEEIDYKVTLKKSKDGWKLLDYNTIQ